MDPGGIGAVIGICVMTVVGIGTCVYDRYKKNSEPFPVQPLLIKKPSFKVKNLFSHVEI
jgi:hypothetical protein